jgi:DNA-binding beta-propeller fold protein YncE
MKKGGKHSVILSRKQLVYPVLFILALLFVFPSYAQNGAYQIQWIGQYPSVEGAKSQSFGEKISRLVFGKRPQLVVKPFNLLAESPAHYWILDQGAGTLFEVDEGEGHPHRSMRKSGFDFSSLVGISKGPGGSLLFSDSRKSQVMQLSGEKLSVFADSLLLTQPTGLAFNPKTGEIWVVETGKHRLSLFSSEGEKIRSIGERGTEPGAFNFPTFIWIDSEGRVYVVDSMNFRVQIFDSKGRFLSTFGEAGDATGYMARPKGIAVDSRGHIYVADALFHVVQIFDHEGNFLSSFGAQGQGQGEFWMPSGIFIDPADHIYVADTYNARVQVFQLERN